MLIQQLTTTHQVSVDRFYRTLYESLLDPRLVTSSKQSLYLNLLFKALKADLSQKRVKAFVKRLIQILGLQQPSFICGVFYLIRELEKTFASLHALIDQPEEHPGDDEEVFKDVPDEDDAQPEPEHTQPAASAQQKSTSYDSRKRDPEHSNADKSCLWELVGFFLLALKREMVNVLIICQMPYLTHFHPSVSVSAQNLLFKENMQGKPDLTLHTLSHFLDRFVYRNPKASSGLRGSSIMQPLAGGDGSGLLVTAGRTGKGQEPVNSEKFWKKRSEEVSAEDAFFHDYFNLRGKDKSESRKAKKKADDKDKADSEDEEGEIWKALVESRPDVEGEIDSDDDLDMDDLESAIGEDSGGEEEEEEEAHDDADGKADDEPSDDEDAFDMDVSGDEAFLNSDDELPAELDGGVELPSAAGKEEEPTGRQKKRKLKSLPTFASMEDYAALLENE